MTNFVHFFELIRELYHKLLVLLLFMNVYKSVGIGNENYSARKIL